MILGPLVSRRPRVGLTVAISAELSLHEVFTVWGALTNLVRTALGDLALVHEDLRGDLSHASILVDSELAVLECTLLSVGAETNVDLAARRGLVAADGLHAVGGRDAGSADSDRAILPNVDERGHEHRSFTVVALNANPVDDDGAREGDVAAVSYTHLTLPTIYSV